MRVWVLHNKLRADATEDERDVLAQVEAVSAALVQLGHPGEVVDCTLDLESLRERITREQPDVVVNLVEALSGTDRLAHLVPGLLDVLGVPFTGCSAKSLMLTNDKLLAKRLMRQSALPTPDWWEADSNTARYGREFQAGRYIIKAIHEHASFGLDDDVVIDATRHDELLNVLHATQQRWQRPCFAEQYVDGREFNLSLIADRDGPQVLPPAEIDFQQFPAGKPRIVGYKAKWASDSFEFVGTPRTFEFRPDDQPLLAHLCALAHRCWDVFDLSSYARVDFRVNAAGEPFILEINANPCLSPDAGFAAALTQAGISFSEAVRRMIEAARGTLHSEGAKTP